MNELMLLLSIIIVFYGIYYFISEFKKDGLIILMIIMTIISNILVLKTVTIFTLDVNLGFVSYVSVFLLLNIYIQNYGPKNLLKLITIIVGSLLSAYVIIYLSSMYYTSYANLNGNLAYMNLFDFDIRLLFASIISIFVGLYVSGQIYYLVRRVKNKAWVSNLLTIIIGQFIDTIIFVVVGYFGNIPIIDLVLLFLIRYMFKLLVGLIGTFIVYRGSRELQ